MRALWAAPSLLLSPLVEGTLTQNRKSSFRHTTPLDIQPTHGPTRRCHTLRIKSHRGFLQSQLLGGTAVPHPGTARAARATPLPRLIYWVMFPGTVWHPSRRLAWHQARASRATASTGTSDWLLREHHPTAAATAQPVPPLPFVSRGKQGSPHAQNPTATLPGAASL